MPDKTREEAQAPATRDSCKGMTFRRLAPGITTHPLIRRGRPCIVGTGSKVASIAVQKRFWKRTPEQIAKHFDIQLSQVADALNCYAAHTDYIDTDIDAGATNHDRWEETQDVAFRDMLLSRRKSLA